MNLTNTSTGYKSEDDSSTIITDFSIKLKHMTSIQKLLDTYNLLKKKSALITKFKSEKKLRVLADVSRKKVIFNNNQTGDGWKAPNATQEDDFVRTTEAFTRVTNLTNFTESTSHSYDEIETTSIPTTISNGEIII